MEFLKIVFILFMIIQAVKSFNYRKSNYLCCGQWGYIGDDYNPRNIQILGLFNQTRGVHSCGIYIDNEIKKGVNDQKLWMDFIAENPFPETLESGNKVIMGHARQASSGFQHTAENQHPFVCGNKIGQQNGTIKNDYALSTFYGYTKKDWNVDTELMYKIMDEHGYDVLKQYEGYAALMWVHADTPNELFVFKGASKTDLPRNQTVYVERPLYYLKEKNGYYFSSMENSLKVIRKNPEDKIASVDHNRILKFYFDKKGKVRVMIGAQIERNEDNFIQFKHHYNNYQNPKSTALTRPLLGEGAIQNSPQNSRIRMGTEDTITNNLNNVRRLRAFNANLSENNFKNRVTAPEHSVGQTVKFIGGRYLIDFNNKNKYLNGIFRISKEGIVVTDKTIGDIYYFFAGVRLENKEKYQEFCKTPWRNSSSKKLRKHNHYFKRYAFHAFEEPSWVIEMSFWSIYPIKNLPENCGHKNYEEKWYYKGNEADKLVLCPMFNSSKIYFNQGGIHAKTARSDENVIELESVNDIIAKYKEDSIDLANGWSNNSQQYIDSIEDVKDEDIEQISFESGDCCDVNTVLDEVKDVTDEAKQLNKEPLISWNIVHPSVEDLLNSLSINELMAVHHYVTIAIYGEGYRTDESESEAVKQTLLSHIYNCVEKETTLKYELETEEQGSLEEQLKYINIFTGDILYQKEKQLIRELYGDDLAQAFNVWWGLELEQTKKMFNEEEQEAEEAEMEEKDQLVSDSVEEIIFCCDTLDGVEQDLDLYPEDVKITNLKKIVEKNNASLKEDVKDYVTENCSDSEYLLKKIN